MNDTDCIFCKIVSGAIPSTKVFENENVFAFKDLHPSANKHYLFIHKIHTQDINDLSHNQPEQLAHLFQAMRDVTRSEGLDNSGFRIVTNQGPHAGQTVFHTHFHLLGGEQLRGFGK